VDQVAEVVTFLLELSLYPAVALNACVLPTASEGLVGVSVIEVTTGFCPGFEVEEEPPPPQAVITSRLKIKAARGNLNIEGLNP